MTDLNVLKNKFKESGMTVTAIAEKTGILRETLYNRLNGNTEFKVNEIVSLTEVLNLSKDERDLIFFGN